MDDEAGRLVGLGRIQTRRLAEDIVWNSMFLHDYENRYGIDPHVVQDFAEGYLDWLSDCFPEEVEKDGGDGLFVVLKREMSNNGRGYSFYDYTHFIYCKD